MLNLTASQQALFALLRASLNKPFTMPEGPDWAIVRQEAGSQAVFLLAHSALRKMTVPEEVREEWLSTSFLYYRRNIFSQHAISETHKILSSDSRDYIILKGLASAAYYPDPTLRLLGDVDFLINPALRPQIEAAFEAEGYEKAGNTKAEPTVHVALHKPNQQLELHIAIPGIPSGKAGNLVRDYISGAEKQPVILEGSSGGIHIPRPEYHGLIILLHMRNHMFSEGLGLRQLMDWACFVEKTEKDPFWQTSLLPLLKNIEMLHYASAVTKTSALYLGTVCPSWVEDVPEDLCDAVMEDILTGGNLGVKNQSRSVSRMLYSVEDEEKTGRGKLASLRSNLRSVVTHRYPVLRRLPFLYPFLALYVALRRVILVLFKKRESLLAASKYADERKKLYSSLTRH